MQTVTLKLHPVDVWMFRESRYFGTSAGASSSDFPLPKTIAGAVRTYMMHACNADYRKIRDQMKQLRSNGIPDGYMDRLKACLKECCQNGDWAVDATLAGPFLVKSGVRYYPLPRSVGTLKDGTGFVALKPAEDGIPGWSEDGQRPLVTGADGAWEHPDGWFVTTADLGACLAGGNPGCKPDGSDQEKHWLPETRVGVGINPQSFTAAEGILYTSTFMRLANDRALEVDITLDDTGADALRTHVKSNQWARVGGEARGARVEVVDDRDTPPAATADGRPLLYFATPALFGDGKWGPSSRKWGVGVVSASVGRPTVFSGWDLAANLPMQTRYAVPAGAVYYLEKATWDANTDPHATCQSDNADDAAAGWGYCLRGVW